jgi:acyl-CoA reductase-like NAD-dependent aldehyde dehydrogenase
MRWVDNFRARPLNAGSVNVNNVMMNVFQFPVPMGGWSQSGVGAGTETAMYANSLEPQPDGTLRGLTTATVLTNECGHQGLLLQTPFVAIRKG